MKTLRPDTAKRGRVAWDPSPLGSSEGIASPIGGVKLDHAYNADAPQEERRS
jgi:hypothetical protein